MDVAQTFNVALHVPRLNREEVKNVLGQVGAFAGSDVSIWGWGGCLGCHSKL